MNTKPKVTIITTCYNSASTIKDTITSVLKQTYENIEYVIKDGESKDDTIEIIKYFEPKFNGRLKWISVKDNGIYDGMNQGIRLSTGNIIGILNSDDFFSSCYIIEDIVNAMTTNNVDAVYGNIHFASNNNLKKTVRKYSSKYFHPFWLRFGFMPAHPSFYIKRELYEKAGLYKTDYKIGADFEMMVRLFHNYHITYHYIDKDFVTMRTGGASNRNIKSRITLLKEDVRACKQNGLYTNTFFIMLKYIYKVFELR